MCEAFASSVATNIVSELGKLLFGPIGRQFGYVLCYKSNVKDLKDEVKKLQATRERVQNSVDEAVNNGKTIIEEVNNWLDNVENKAKEEEDLFKKGGSAKDACLGGWLPNPVVRHPIGRKVKKMIPVIQGLLDESKTDIFKKVYYENLPMGIVTRTPATARSTNNKEDVLQSRAKIIKEVMEALVDDKVSVIGVYGPPGVGKSKLLKDVQTRVREENLFHVVAVADVKHNPDLERINNEIRDALGLYLVTETTLKGRANRLREKLERDSKEQNILIILDDLWEKLELEDIGIPCVDGNKVKGCKLLLTSRRLDVLRFHMGAADPVFKLKLLEPEESRKLFEKTVGDNYLKFEDMVGGVVENCGGLPLVIHSVGTRLRHGDSVDWRNALNDKGGSDVKSIVQNIYNGLPDERIKLLFSICVLTSGRIWITDLVAYYMGRVLNEKRSTTIEEARDKLILDLRSLRDYSLLTESDDMEEFGMHDLFVEVGVSIASTKWDTLVGRKDRGFRDWSNDELRKCTAISFCHVGIDDLPEKLDCPKLRILLLLESNSSLKIPDSFFVSMEKLQVLHLAGLSFTSLPLSIGSLENLNSLILRCYNLEDVTGLGKLKKLQFLRLTGSKIARLPREIGEIEELRILDLRGCFELKTIEAGMLERLANIEELYLGGFCQWEAEDKAPRSNASLAELKSMKRLKTLHITIPGSTNLSSDLPFGNLNEHRIQIGGTPFWWEVYKGSRILKLELKNDNLPHQEWMQQCLGRTQDLRLKGLRDGGDSIHDLCTKGFEELKHLVVQDNRSFHYVVDSTQPAFTRLESLVLRNLSNLKTICRDCLAPESLSELKTVIVENCGATKHLFPSSAMRIFLQLEEITIRECCLMGQIIEDAKTDEFGDEIQDDPPVSCKLRRLTLINLPEMTSFCETGDCSNIFLDGQQVSLPSLESLTLSELPKLKYIWNSQLPYDVSKLKFLKVKDCAFLSSIIPSNLLIVLQNLEAITVGNCQKIREVFDFERPTISEDVKILSRLTTLTLSNLPRLEHIWSKDSRLCLPNLRALKVEKCESLRYIFSSSMAKTFQQIKEIKIVKCKLLEDIIDMQEEESEEAASTETIEFPLLTSLYLEELPNLRTFSYGTYHMHCPTLTRPRISRCPKMMTFSSFERKQQRKTADIGLQQGFGTINSSCSLPVLFNNNVLFPSLEQLTLMSLRGLTKIWHSELSEKSFCKLASITICDCENLSHIFPPTLIGRLQSLEMIEVVKCTSFEALMEHVAVNSKRRQDRLVGLKKVKLRDLPMLNALVPIGAEATLSLPSLTNISLHGCQSLRYLVTNNDTSCTLDKLEMLDISGCNNMEEVVVTQKRANRNLKTVKFPHLRTLKLHLLKSLISFGSGSSAYEFPSLRELSILDCTKLKAFIQRPPASGLKMMTEGSAHFDESPRSLFDKKVSLPSLESLTLSELPKLKYIWNSQLPFDVSKLKFLEVKGCEFLLSIIPSNLLIVLQNLEAVIVENCLLIREVFDFERPTINEDVKILSRLTTLTLSNLPRLEHLWSKDQRLFLQNLRALKVQNCESLRLIFSSSMAKTPQHIKEIEIVDCRLLEEIIDVQEEDSEEAALTGTMEFSLLTSLSLEELPNLRTFSYGTYRMHCPTLTRLRISGCPKMMTFSSVERKQQEKTADIGFQRAFGGTNSSCSLPVLFNNNVIFPSLEKLTLMSLPGLTKIWHDELSEESFCKLTSIKVHDCENLSHIFPSTFIGRLQSLEKIKVVNCSSLDALMEHIAVNSKKRQDRLVCLKKLKLWDLPRLNALVLIGTGSTLSLPSLTNVSLHRCHSLKYLITNDTSLTLDKLEMLDISGCNNMKEVVVTQERADRNLKTMKFPHLHTLKLHLLKSLISFSSGSSAYEFPSLKELSILNCTKFKTFIQRLPTLGVEMMTAGSTGFDESPRFLFDEKVVFPKLEELRLIGIQSRGFWENEMPNESFCQLKVLEVKQCPNLLNVIPSFVWKRLLHCMQSLTVVSCPCLRNLFTMSTAKNLVQLQHLVLDGCEEMEYVVAAEEEKPEEAVGINVISKLVTLHLRKMIKLRSFYQGKHTSEWPSLKELTVEDCKAVEAIIGDASCRRLEGSVPTCQPFLLVEKVEFSNMESMTILHMDNMEQIWLGELASSAFTKLKTLEVKYCEKLSSIFSSHTILTRFQNLEKITVTDCGSLEVVFQVQEFNFSKTHSTSKFELGELKLERLPKMKHVWSGHLCGTLDFECLRYMKAKSCESLKSLFPVSIAKSTTQLEEVMVWSCGVEEIIAEEVGVGMSAGDFFPELTTLILFDLPELRSLYRSSHTKTWPLLKKLWVSHCDKMRSFSFACEFQSCQGTNTNENRPAVFSFEKVSPQLEAMALMREDVVMLQQQQRHVFGNLEYFVLSCYDDENDAFPSNFLLQCFPNLKGLMVICSSFEEIFPEDAPEHGGAIVPCGGLTDMEKPPKELGNLNGFYLYKLGNLRRVWKDGSLMAQLLEQIEQLDIIECPSLSIVFPTLTSFQRLAELQVKHCAGLVHMGTCLAMTSLVHLSSLTLKNCAAMEDVITNDENGVEEISFPGLRQLRLEGLPRLESFSSTSCAFSFPSLERVVIKECPKMNIFCKGALKTPKLHQVHLSNRNNDWRWEGDLNTTVQLLSA